jgi:hypothetical protein
MTTREQNRFIDCLGCAQVVNSSIDPVFRIQGSGCLCVECALKRGGSYDASHEAWVRAPNLAGLN